MKKIIFPLIAVVAIVLGYNYFKGGSSTKGANLETLLEYVPKDTPYLFANKKPTSDEFRQRQAKSFDSLLANLEKQRPKNKAYKFLSSLVKSYKDNNFQDYGLLKDRSAVVYGYNYYPVARTQITDSKTFINALEKMAKETNSTIKWQDCAGYKCTYENIEKNFTLAIVVKSKTVAMALYPADKKDEYIKHLTNKADSKNSYSMADFDKMLSENNFKGYSDGFIKLKPTLKGIISHITTYKELNSAQKAKLTECLAPMADDFTNYVDKITVGYKELDTDKIESEVVIHTTKSVADTLKTVVSKNAINKETKEPLYAMGLRVDAKNLSNAMMSLTNYTVSEAKKYKCSSIDTSTLLQNASSASLMLSMFGSQVSEAYIGFEKIKISEKDGKPELVGALIEIVSANPTALIGMLKAKSPSLANVNFPKDGKEIDLLEVLPKPSPKFITSLSASLKDNTISVNVSNAATKEFKDEKHTLLWFNMNNNKLLDFFNESVKSTITKRKISLEKLKNMGVLNENDYKKRVEALQQREEKSITGYKAIMGAYPKDFETALSIFIDDRGIVIGTKQERVKQ